MSGMKVDLVKKNDQSNEEHANKNLKRKINEDILVESDLDASQDTSNLNCKFSILFIIFKTYFNKKNKKNSSCYT